MKSVKSVATIFVSILIGAALGAYLSRPPKVQAIGSPFQINLQKVEEGNNNKTINSGSKFLGFACTQEDCYIATSE